MNKYNIHQLKRDWSHQTNLWESSQRSLLYRNDRQLVPHNSWCASRVSALTYPLQYLPGKNNVECAWRPWRQSELEEEPSPVFDSSTILMALQGQQQQRKPWWNTSKVYDMEISQEKTRIMAKNNTEGATNDVTMNGQALESVSKFKYLSAIVTDEGSTPEMLSGNGSGHKLKPMWNDKNVKLRTKVRLLRSPVISILLHACEAWQKPSSKERQVQRRWAAINGFSEWHAKSIQ